MNTTRRNRARIPAHPGELLERVFMPDYGLKAPTLAKKLGVPRSRVVRLIKDGARLDSDMALRLSRLFGNSPEFWMNAQVAHELAKGRAERAAEIERTVTPEPTPEAA